MNTERHRRTGGGRKPGEDGFTLIELMVALSLTIILIGAILQTFDTAMQVYERGTARLDIYSNIRSAMDVMERDLAGIIPSDTGGQRFVLAQNVDSQFPGDAVNRFGAGGGGGGDFGRVNGWTMEPGNPDLPNGGAADMLGFIGDTVVAGEKQKVGVVYQIAPILDSSLLGQDTGSPGAGDFQTVQTHRILTSLKRVTISPASEITGSRKEKSDGESGGGSGGEGEGEGEEEKKSRGNVGLYYGPNGPSGEMWNSINTGLNQDAGTQESQDTGAQGDGGDSESGTQQGPEPRETTVGYLSQYILSFNIEVMPDNTLDNGFIDLNATDDTEQKALSDLELKYLNPNENVRESQHYPIGNGSEGEPDLPDALRVTIRFTDGRKEVQERVVQRVFWIPVE